MLPPPDHPLLPSSPAILDVMDRWRTGEGALARRSSALANTRLRQRRRRKRKCELLANGCVWWHSTGKVEINQHGRKEKGPAVFILCRESHCEREDNCCDRSMMHKHATRRTTLNKWTLKPLVARGSLSLHYSFNFPTAPVKLQCHER